MEHGNLLKSYLIGQLTTAKKQLTLIGPEGEMEALHRFRVALRRFRSVLDAYTRHLYAPEAVVKSMVKGTNPLRETDVFLASVSSAEFPGLHQALTTYRNKLYKKLWKADTAERFDHTIDALICDLSKLELDQSDKKLLRRGKHLYADAKKAYHKLTKDSDEAMIHETRLRYKQARYVLEFLDEAGLADETGKIRKVKKLLDHFGAIQDAANQLEWLRRFCDKHPSGECADLFAQRQAALTSLKEAFEF